ncbi:MAG: secretin and TonB N-terminal domain-containing protein, partial [Deltaproteobacteria bacterium]|nr:secretin and TonB N-terminal domain-containing protein [Deltaproteobacteria bacterium]
MPIPKMIGNHLVRFASPLLLLLFLSGCIAGQASFTKGNQALETQNYDQAVIEYLAAVESNPANHEYRLKLDQTRSRAALEHKIKGDAFIAQQQFVKALQEYQLATDLDGSLYTAFDGLERARDYLQVEKLLQEAKNMLQANRKAQAQEAVDTALSLRPEYQPTLQLKAEIKQSQYALVDGVELEVISSEPINLNFRETKIPDVFDILTKLSGINFILDEDVRSDKTTLFLEQATFAQALELLLRMNKLDKKILNKKTIILFPKTRDKQKQFEDQIIQTFYLSHIDAKKAVNMLRTMLQVR